MEIRAEFDALVTQWKAHCQGVSASSNADAYTDCDPYRQIVALGENALPLIHERYRGNDDEAFFSVFGWASAVREIAREALEPPDEAKGNVMKTRDFVIGWLNETLTQE